MQLWYAGGQARGVYAPLQTLVGRVGGSTLLQLQPDLVQRTLGALGSSSSCGPAGSFLAAFLSSLRQELGACLR